MTHFERLGLPGRFSIDAAALETAYLQRSRAVHPDFHAQSGDIARQASEAAAAALNDAYATLADPFRRADYLLNILGGPSAAECKALSPQFLAEMMDLRETLDAARGTPGLADVVRDIDSRIAATDADIAAGFAALETAPDPAAARQRIRTLLNTAKTLRSLRRDAAAPVA
jgi:molecular chaperone HscB